MHLSICDPDERVVHRVAAETGAQVFLTLEDALASRAPDIGFVCTPPSNHVEQAIRLVERGAHVFVEKPLSDNSAGILRLHEAATRSGRVVQVGYNLRFHPGIRKVKDIVDEGLLGRIVWARFEVGQYLPDWRPGRDYRQTYTANARQGGGILLDASHEIDYACWLLGCPVELSCMTGRSGILEMDAEDCATLLVRFASGAQADIHVDCLQRTYSRQCKVAGELGTVVWDYELNNVRLWRSAEPDWQSISYSFDNNDMYVAELGHFLNCAMTGARPEVGIVDGMRALCLVELAKSGASAPQLVDETWLKLLA